MEYREFELKLSIISIETCLVILSKLKGAHPLDEV